MKTVGWIALDIDGTITLDKYSVPEPVIAFLRERVKEGWRIAMATGRPVSFATLALDKFDFPYLFLPQNGSAVLEMPGKRCLFKHYLLKTKLLEIEQAFQGIAGDFIMYGGYEGGDKVYWRSARFDEEQIRYLAGLWARQKETPVAVRSLEEIPQTSFSLIKCFGRSHEMDLVASRLRKGGHFNVARLRDPFEEDYYILLITDVNASKGQSLEEAMRLLGERGIVIAAGDDENDASLLRIADTAIAMAHAPASLQDLAHLIAPPTSEMGILHALQLAMRKYAQ